SYESSTRHSTADRVLGTYSHYAGSLHIYEGYIVAAKQYIAEGWQDREAAAMPRMPPGDPWQSVRSWLEAEETIRAGRRPAKRLLNRLDDYWADLVRLLCVYTNVKKKKRAAIAQIKAEMKCRIFNEYITQKAKPKRTLPRSG